MLEVNARVRIPLREFHFSFSRSSGAGGQNVNKVNTKATLRWQVEHSPSLPDDVRQRFVQRYRRRITHEGELVLTSQRFRDQGRNVADCLEKLRAMLEEVSRAPRPRKRTRPTKASKERRLQAKRGHRHAQAAAPSPGRRGLEVASRLRLSHLAPLDKALVLILVPLWVVWFGLGVRTQVLGLGTAAVGLVVEDADHYPVLSGQYAALLHSSDPLASAGLRSGDRLIRLGETDLRGVGTLAFLALSAEEGGRDPSVRVVSERGGERFETSLPLAPASVMRSVLALSLAFAAASLFLLLRGASDTDGARILLLLDGLRDRAMHAAR